MRIAVVGLGHVGLPLAALLARHHVVVGLEANQAVVADTNRGVTVIAEPGLKAVLGSAVRSGRLRATFQPDEIASSPVKIIAVGTPYNRDTHTVDSSQLEAALAAVTAHLRRHDTVILKSTVPPGTTEGWVRDSVEAAGFKVPRDVGLVFAPERMVEGRAIRDFCTLPKILGATDDRSFRVARAALAPLGGHIVRVRNPTTAEMAKMMDNYTRFVLLGLTNELAMIARAFGVDPQEVLHAFKDHYPRNAGVLSPGPGVGGSCLNKDPFALGDEAGKRGLKVRMLASAQMVNESMVDHVRYLVTSHARPGARVLVAGAAFKGDTEDTRFSTSIPLGQRLRRDGYTVTYSDPLVKRLGRQTVGNDLYGDAASTDAVVFLTDHSVYRRTNLRRLAGAMHRRPVLIDTRALFRRNRAESLGFRYVRLGDP